MGSFSPSYPGVYIEELSSGQHTITGVATSIAAFIGWAPQGPVNEAVMVESFPAYQAIFGSFVPGVYLAYAVNQFFQNGGQQAYIVRLVWERHANRRQTESRRPLPRLRRQESDTRRRRSLPPSARSPQRSSQRGH